MRRRLPYSVLLRLSALSFALLGASATRAQSATPAPGAVDGVRSSEASQTAAAAKVSPEDRALARELGVQAFEAFDAGKYEEAETLFARAISLYDAPTLRRGRARALERLGRLVAATEEYRSLLRTPAEPNEPASFAEVRVTAQRELEALLPRLGQLTLQLETRDGADLPPFTLEVDGRAWPDEAVGVPRPFDPGTHQVRLRVEDGRSIERSVTVNEGSSETLVLQLPSGAQSATDEPPRPAAAPAALPEDASSGNEVLIAGIATGVLAAAAVVSGFVALSKRSEYDDRNRADVSTREKQELRDSAQTWSWLNTGLSVAAAAGAGLTWYYYSESDAEHGQPSAAAWGVQYSGEF